MKEKYGFNRVVLWGKSGRVASILGPVALKRFGLGMPLTPVAVGLVTGNWLILQTCILYPILGVPHKIILKHKVSLIYSIKVIWYCIYINQNRKDYKNM